jgi:hypothetical protein
LEGIIHRVVKNLIIEWPEGVKPLLDKKGTNIEKQCVVNGRKEAEFGRDERKFDLVLRAKKTEGGILFSPMICDINLE